MTRADFAQQLLDAADRLEELSHSQLQVLLRRAALRITNKTQATGTMIVEPDVVEGVDAFAAESEISRDEATNTIIRDWLIAHGYGDDSDDE